METQTRQAMPGSPAQLPLHRIRARLRLEEIEVDVLTGAARQHEEAEALAYRLGVHRGRHLFRLADADGTPKGEVWALREEEILGDVPADVQPAQVPERIISDREKLAS